MTGLHRLWMCFDPVHLERPSQALSHGHVTPQQRLVIEWDVQGCCLPSIWRNAGNIWHLRSSKGSGDVTLCHRLEHFKWSLGVG
jgi:hypothetical protein